MVRIDRIVMQNFKSFSGKVSIPFPKNFSAIAGPNGSGKCVDYDTKVTLADGRQMKIGDLVEERIKERGKEDGDGFIAEGDGTKILSMGKDLKVEERPIMAFIKRKAPERMLSIMTRSGREIVSTPYHPFFGINENGVFSLRADEIEKGRKIAVPREIKTSGMREMTDNLLDDIYVPYSDGLRAALKAKMEERGLTRKAFSEISGVPYMAVKSLMDGQSIRHAHLKKIIEAHGVDFRIGELKSHSKVFRIPEMSEELARFLGYMISEGRSTETNQMWFVNDDMELVNDFSQICEGIGIGASVFSYKGDTKDVIAYSKPMQRWLEANFEMGIGSVSKEKRVPELIISGTKNIASNFLSALFEGDGYFNLSGRRTYFEYCTASKELARGVQHLLLRFGVLSNIREKEKYASNTERKTKRKYYSVYVYGEAFERMIDSIELRGRKRKTTDKIKQMKFERNPNTDLISGINPLIKELAKECGIKIKSIRKECPKLAAYCENRCECSRDGVKECVSAIRKHGTITSKAEDIIGILLTIAESDIYWDEIIEIRDAIPKEWVYDLAVDDTHNYIANDFFVHNSNISDSLMFVLGTTSAKSIRANKMLNLIFNGGKDRKPAEYCEASIYIDNRDKKIAGEEDEVKLTRRITRSGITVYKINGRTVTRSSVLDLLYKANISTEGYNIIMQGDVTRVIEMNSNERREIIDEISGISEFDEKREKALKEMEKVEAAVRENMIIVAEKQRLVQRLKEEKENAEKYQKLEKELRKAKASLTKKRLEDYEKRIKQLDAEIAEEEGALEEREKEFVQSEKEMEEREKELAKKGKILIEKSRNYEIAREIDKKQTEMLRLKDKIEMNSREIERIRQLSDMTSDFIKPVLRMNGVKGTVRQLYTAPAKYSTSLEVAIGRHKEDVVVEDDQTAVDCINYLKQARSGRARFLPMNRIITESRKEYKGKEKIIGYAIDLIKFDSRYAPIFNYVLRNTIVADMIETARKIKGFRVVTLDGDLVETSGAMTGGYYAKRQKQEIGWAEIEKENEEMEARIEAIEKEISELKKHEEKESEDVKRIDKQREDDEKRIDELRKRRKELYDERLNLQSRVSKKKIDKARVEAAYDNIRIEMNEYKDVKEYFTSLNEGELQEKVTKTVYDINRLGPVNMKAIEEYSTINVEFEQLKGKLNRLLEEKDAIMRIVEEVESRRKEKFMGTFMEIRNNFSVIYMDMTHGVGNIKLEEEENIESGLVIEANPSGKKITNIDSMSGGEKTITALSFLFAVMQRYNSPFYILDEVEAALDKSNTKKIVDLIKKYSGSIQFIVITHNDFTISEADSVYGVSMESGVSRVFGIEMPAR